MLSKNKIKFINTLKKKKTRNEKGLFLAEGEKIVSEILHSSMDIELLCGKKSFLSSLIPKVKESINEILTVDEIELKKISSLKTPNEALAVVKQPTFKINHSQLQNSLSIGLDAINDPGNLGTIVRIADWFGIKDVICSEDTVDLYNPKSVQATMGSISRIRVHYTDIVKIASELANTDNYPIYGCFLEGENIYQASLSPNGLIILGSESHGISDKLKRIIQRKLLIPNFSDNPKATSESLNVSIAAGIVCSEFKRRAPYSK